MVSATDYSSKTNGHAFEDDTLVPKRRRRSGLFAALAAPFRDVDERAIRRKGKNARNKIIGAPFANHAPTARAKSG